MSFSTEQARSFLGPLKNRTSVFLVEGRRANLSFAKVITSATTTTGSTLSILDLDALYSSNAEVIFTRLPDDTLESTRIHIPEPGSSLEQELSGLFGTESTTIMIDSLNSLHHLLSSPDRSTRSRKLAFTMAGLSYLARTARRAVLFTMYKREKPARSGKGRPISDLSDLTVSVGVHDSQLLMRCERGSAWPGGRFSISIP